MISDADKALLAWALDGVLTERHSIGLFKIGSVKKAAREALRDPEVRRRVLALVELMSPDTARSIADFFNQ